jgi:uncharacterized protein DUF4372/DDE family transposase
MNEGRTIFSQLMEHAPHHHFRRCVERYRGNHGVRSFRCWDQFLCMAFAQLTYRESLRDIEACLSAVPERLYHMGIRGTVSRSTLADANERRDWRIYADFAQVLISQARRLYVGEPFGVDLDETVYAFDSTTINLCLSLFPWAHFRRTKGAIKLHTLLDLRGNIPAFIRITSGTVHDVTVLDELLPEPGALYVLDRGYIDFARLYHIHEAQAGFVIRARKNLRFRRRYSHPVDRSTRRHLRPDGCPGRREIPRSVSGTIAARAPARPRNREVHHSPEQPLLLTGHDAGRTLPLPLAG